MKICNLPKIFMPFYCNDLVRVGKDYDGGYLVNEKDILKTDKLISFGIGEDISFEEQFCHIKNIPIVAYDLDDNIHKSFFTGTNIFINEKVTYNTVHDCLKDQNIFLKCDIEGGEYGILNNIIEYRYNLTGITIEFHDIHLDKNLNLLFNFISKIGLDLLHIHVNNYTYLKGDNFNIPTVLELTFSSSDNVVLKEFINIPNDLDMPNNPNDEQFRIFFV